MKVLIVDGGGRGAALVDKYAKSKHVGKILVVPGNDLMQINSSKPVITYPDLKTTSVKEILEIIKKEKVDLVDVSQDNAVEAGVTNEALKLGVGVVGPTKEAGQLEWDKAWAREFMIKYKIPSPKFQVFNSEKDGLNFVKNYPKKKWFIKAAGLAEGKGVIPGENLASTIKAIKQMKRFGISGETFLIEEWLVGEEFSAFALCDGKNFKIVGYAQDHKRVLDGDKGANTGGMGCVSNPLVVDKKIKKEVEEIFSRVISGMKNENKPYRGVLYLGGMVVESKGLLAGRQVYVIEFNARWGDPEAEVLLSSIKNDLFEVGQAIINGQLKQLKLKTDKKVRIAIAACAKGYPSDYTKVKGEKILGLDEVLKTNVKVFGAGIKKKDIAYLVNSGRVLFLMAEGKDIVEARHVAYNAISKISIEGDNLHYRKDIGWRDLARLNK